jgi:hypothetical protein
MRRLQHRLLWRAGLGAAQGEQNASRFGVYWSGISFPNAATNARASASDKISSRAGTTRPVALKRVISILAFPLWTPADSIVSQ